MPGQELPPTPERGYIDALEGKSPQLNEIIETLHQNQIGTPIYIYHTKKRKELHPIHSRALKQSRAMI